MSLVNKFLFAFICITGLLYSNQAMSAVPGSVSNLEISADEQSKHVLIHGDIPFLVTLPAKDADGHMVVSWDDVSGATYYQYRICLDGVCENWQDTTGSTAGLSLPQAGNYTVEVRACNNDGCGSIETTSAIEVTGIGSGDGEPETPPARYTLAKHGGIPAQNASSDAVGAIAGEFRVNESGQATYNIPIYIPTGRAGVKPQVSLAYSSQGGPGVLGLGWNLSAGSAVTRCRQTDEIDNNEKGVTLSYDDRFCLDGQRLILASGVYGESGSTYRTEIASQTKVVAKGTAGNGPAYFEVYRKDGSVSYYGNTPDSQLRANSVNSVSGTSVNTTVLDTVLVWSQNKYIDNINLQSPNEIIYEYDKQENFGEQKLTKITYSPNNEIEFLYGRSFIQGGMGVGGYQRNSQKLTQIIVRDSNQEVRKYDFEYKTKEQTLYDEIEDGVFGDPLHTNIVDDYPLRLLSVSESAKADSGNWVSRQPTTFDWQESTSGYQQASQSTKLNDIINHKSVGGTIYGGNYQFADVNGDGYQDMVYANKSNEEINFRIAKSKGSNADMYGGSFEVLTCAKNIGQQKPKGNDFTWALIDFNGNGRSDLFTTEYVSDGNYEINVYPSIYSGCFSSTSLVAGLTTSSHETARPQDYNGDGLPDLLHNVDGSWKLRLMQRTGDVPTGYQWGDAITVSFTDLSAVPSSDISNAYSEEFVMKKLRVADFNGDGKTDLVARRIITRWYTCNTMEPLSCSDTYSSEDYVFTSEGQGVFKKYIALPSGVKLDDDNNRIEQFVDVNGDGLADYLYKSSSNNYWNFRLNTGKKLLAPVEILGLGTTGYPSYTDYNHDGRIDIAFTKNSKLHILPGTETGFHANLTNTGIDIGSGGFVSTFADVNNDGIQEHLRLDFDGGTHYIRVDRPKHSNETHRYAIETIENGMGNVTNITYKPLSHSGLYTKATDGAWKNWGASDACNGDSQAGRDACSPVFDMNGPMYVVEKAISSSPTKSNPSATAGVAYNYGKARLQAKGRGFLGFEWLETTDLQTNIKTKTTYRHDYPYIGSPVKTVTTYNGYKLSESVNHWADKVITLSSGNKVRFPYVLRSSESKWSLNTDGGTSFQSETLTESAYDTFGNVTKLTNIQSATRHYNELSGVPDLTTVSGLTKTVTVNTYNDNVSKWQLGRLAQATVTHSRQGQADVVRTSAFEYDPATGFLLKEIIEPGSSDPNKNLSTIYRYDSFGNITLKRTCSMHVSSCETSGQASDSNPYHINRWTKTVYDTSGRYPVRTTNAFGQTTSEILARNNLGQPTQIRNINGAVSYKAYGAFGHNYFNFSPDGSWSSETKFQCGSNCPSVAVYGVRTVNATGGKSYVYYDALGREVQKAGIHFDGNYVVSATEYNVRGLPVKVTEPEIQANPYSEPAGYYSTTTNFDVLGRPEVIKNPDGGQTYINYHATSTTTINPLQQTKTEFFDASGKVTRVDDTEGSSITYSYTSTGELESLKFNGQIQSKITYDSMGRKIEMMDKDKGGTDGKSWTYAYNALGELVLQTDAKGQTIETFRDTLGRTIKRVDRNSSGTITGNQRWIYNNTTSNTSYGIGQLIEEKDLVSGYQFNPGYDDLGRVVYTQTIIDDQLYLSDQTFDQYGRVFQSFDAASSEFANAGVRNVYNQYGYLESVHDARGAPTSSNRLRKIGTMDARGNVTSEIYGNGVETTRTYYEDSGRIKTILSAKGSDRIQHLEYDWDYLGNLTRRQGLDSVTQQLLVEDFTYDNLNRMLKASHPNEIMTLSYDAGGNILSKSGVGNYTYGGECNGVTAGPHAVTNAGGKSYCYDSNGNMVSGDGRNMVYSTFDKLTKVTKSGHTTEFKYAPSRSRFKRVDSKNGKTTTTHYIGNVEVIQHSDKSYITYRRNLGGVIQEERTNGTKQASYLHTDHLGSTDVISNASGNVAQQFSFNAFGEQRSHVDWITYLSTPEIQLSPASNALTSRGFTGHEQMDEVGLIHMNGRVYDPKLGRFIQADPHIQSPSDSQSLNRYSYVKNNPLSYTDPTGYFFKKLKSFVKKYWKAIVAVVVAYYTFGLVQTWALEGIAASAASGGAFTMQLGTAKIVAGAVAGAASGFMAGGIISGTLDGALKGAASGAVLGGVMGYYGDSYTLDRVLADGVGNGVAAEINGGSFKDGLKMGLMVSLATYTNVKLRQYELKHSEGTPGQIGDSPGFRGAEGKLGGGRIVEEHWIDSGAAKHYATSADLEGAIQKYLDYEKVSLSPLGGYQGGQGIFMSEKITYKPGGLQDYIVEGYAGTHDALNHWYHYNANGTAIARSGMAKWFGEILNGANVIIATPIVAPSLVPDYMRSFLYESRKK